MTNLTKSTTGREWALRYFAAYEAGRDLHLGRTSWVTDGDIVSRVAEHSGPLTPAEAELVVEAYDAMLAVFEEVRV